jgi:hypothetical protein
LENHVETTTVKNNAENLIASIKRKLEKWGKKLFDGMNLMNKKSGNFIKLDFYTILFISIEFMNEPIVKI